jgi:DNA polymerase-3 subunit gamma/tau
MLAKLAQGGMRDAISLLELCSSSSREITPKTVVETVGITGRDSMINTVLAIVNRDYEAIFAQIDEVVQSSKDLKVFWQNLISFYRDLLVVKSTANAARYLDLTDIETRQITELAAKFKKETLLYHCKLLDEALFSIQRANEVKRVIAELTLVRMCDETLDESNEALLSRIAKLEDAVALGSFAARELPKNENNAESARKTEQNEPVKVVEAKKEEPKAAPQNAPQKRVLRPLRNWMEAVERLGTSDAMLSSFCRAASAYTTEDERILIRFTSEFALNMAKINGGEDKLRGALSVALRREIPSSALILEVQAANQKSALDEIIEAANEL